MKEWDGDKFSGVGIKRMKGYKCDLATDKLQLLRENFWKKNYIIKNYSLIGV